MDKKSKKLEQIQQDFTSSLKKYLNDYDFETEYFSEIKNTTLHEKNHFLGFEKYLRASLNLKSNCEHKKKFIDLNFVDMEEIYEDVFCDTYKLESALLISDVIYHKNKNPTIDYLLSFPSKNKRVEFYTLFNTANRLNFKSLDTNSKNYLLSNVNSLKNQLKREKGHRIGIVNNLYKKTLFFSHENNDNIKGIAVDKLNIELICCDLNMFLDEKDSDTVVMGESNILNPIKINLYTKLNEHYLDFNKRNQKYLRDYHNF